MSLRALPLALPFALAFAGSFPWPALAADCETAVTQSDMNECAVAAWEEEDARLNAVYPQVMAMLKAWDADLPEAERGGAEKLRQAQRAWISYRDASCEVAGWPMRGGSAEPLLVYGCMTELTRARTGDLTTLLEYSDM